MEPRVTEPASQEPGPQLEQMPQPPVQPPGVRRFTQVLRVGVFFLIVLNAVLLCVNLAALLRGERDAYQNQHLRLVTSNLGQLLLVCGIFANVSGQLAGPAAMKRYTVVGGVLLAGSMIALAVSMLIAR